MRRGFLLLATLLIAGCAGTTLRVPVTGQWGGDHVGLMLNSGGGGALDYDCAAGSIDGPLVTDAAGRFSVVGTHSPGHGGPDRTGDKPPRHAATFTGNVRGDVMTLVIDVAATAQRLGPFALRRGATPNLMRCLLSALRATAVPPNVAHVEPAPALVEPDAARQRLIEALVATGAEDRGAFRTLYRLTSAKLFGVCLRICGDRQAAEDVLSEVYLIIWKRAGAFEPGRASPISWLSTIARNRAIDWRRSSGRQPPASVDEIADLPDDSPSSVDRLLKDERDAQLHHCLDELDGQQRDAIRTAFFDGLTYAEIAERRAVPLGTMKSWVRRGLIKLKDCLRDD